MLRLKLLIFLVFASLISSFTQEIYVRKLGLDQGLPSKDIYSLITDKKGYIWGATDYGVFRYDGHSCKIFNLQNGLPDNTILNLFEDVRGRIWMTGFNGKIAYFEGGGIHEIAGNPKLSKLLKNSLVFSIQMSSDGVLWLGTTANLLKIDPENNYRNVTSVVNREEGFTVKEVEPGKFVAFNQRIVHFEERYFHFQGLKGLVFKSYLRNGERTFFRHIVLKDAVLFSDNQGLCLAKKNQPIELIHHETAAISSIFQNKFGLWVAYVKRGVYFYPKSDLRKEPDHFLDGETINAMTLDREDGMWFGVSGKGLFHCPSIDLRKVTGISNGVVALANRKKLMFALNEDCKIFSINESLVSTPLCSLSSFGYFIEKGDLKWQNNQLIISSFTTGSYKNGTFKQFLPNHQHGFSSVQALILDSNRCLFLASNIIYLVHNSTIEKEYFLPSRSRCFAMDEKKDVYVGTLLGLYAFKNNQFHLENKQIKELGQRINHIEVVGDHLLLSGNGNGLLIYNTRNKTLKRIDRKNGLIDDKCNFSIFKDQELWVATNRGISIIQFKNDRFDVERIYNLNTANGLPSNEINVISFTENKVWIGTKSGLCVIENPRSMLNQHLPETYLKQVNINEREFYTENKQVLNLKHDQNTIRFSLSNLSYKNRDGFHYSYRLNGYDQRFKLTRDHEIQYQNLSPGGYRFEVYGLNDQGLKSKVPQVYNFIILPPFWMTWWFISLELISGLAIIYIIFHFRITYIRKKEQTESESNRKILNYRLLALRAQMNPHFIFNSINGIQRFVLQKKSEQAYHYLTKFSNLIRSVLENSNQQLVSFTEELNSICLYIELEQMRFDNKFEFVLEVDDQLNQEDLQIPGMLIQPFLENAIWHGIMPLKDMELGSISLSFKMDENYLCIRISDNGIGREKSKKQKEINGHQSMGIDICVKRLSLLGAESYSLEINDLNPEDEYRPGTLVEIKLPLQILLDHE